MFLTLGPFLKPYYSWKFYLENFAVLYIELSLKWQQQKASWKPGEYWQDLVGNILKVQKRVQTFL